MTASLDLAKIMAEHISPHGPFDDPWCIKCGGCYPCLAYRLAELAQKQAAALASVEREMTASNLYDEAENRVVCVSDLRAALADHLGPESR